MIPNEVIEARKAEAIEVRKMLIGLRKRLVTPPTPSL